MCSGEIRGFGQLIYENQPQTIALVQLDIPFYSAKKNIYVTILAMDITNLEPEPISIEIDPRD